MWSRRRFGLVAMKGVGLSWVVEFFWGNFNFLLRREGLYLYMCVCMGNMEKVRHLGLWRVGNLNKRSEVHAKEVERLLHFWMSTHGWRKIMVYISVFGAGYAWSWTYNTNFSLGYTEISCILVHENDFPGKRKHNEACHCEKLETWHVVDPDQEYNEESRMVTITWKIFFSPQFMQIIYENYLYLWKLIRTQTWLVQFVLIWHF